MMKTLTDSFGFLLIHKPKGMTSFDVIRSLRRKGFPKKMGHTGTLDPFASGLMIVGVGEAVKFISSIPNQPKVYEATIKLGEAMDTLDLDGEIIDSVPVPKLNRAEIENILEDFKGIQTQIPPMYSAKKKAGKKLYDLARKGMTVERDPVPIEVFEIELLDFKENMIKFRASVSTGTYVRVLGSDIAERLGTKGHLLNLKRTQIHSFKLSESSSLDEVYQKDLIPISNLMDLNRFEVNYDDFIRLKNGLSVKVNFKQESEVVQVFYLEHFIGLGTLDNDEIKALRLIKHDILDQYQ